jgi:cyclase
MAFSRRQLLQAGLGIPVLAADRPAPLFDRGFASVTQIAQGVYATIADFSKGPQCGSNGGVIAGRDAVLIVEGHFQPDGAALEIEAARAISKAPVRAAIDTHYHFDHTFGNLAYTRAGIPIMAHEKTSHLMQEQYTALKGVDKTALLAPLEKKIAGAASTIEKARKTEDLEKFQFMYRAIDEAAIAYPTELLREADLPKRIDLGGVTAVIEFHRGHSPTDLIIRVPERDVVFTGDLLFRRAYPVSVDADMAAWRKVLDRFSKYDSRTQFIPGHGPVCSLETVREQIAVFDHLRAHAGKMLHLGVSVEEAERRYVVPKPFQTYRISAWGWTIGPALRSFYQKLA